MKHVVLFYYLISLFTGLFTLTSLFFVFLKNRSKLLKYYIFSYILFTVIIFTFLLAGYSYFYIQIPYIKTLFFICNHVSVSFLIWSLIVLFHSLLEVPYKKTANIVIFIITLFSSFYVVCVSLEKSVAFFLIFNNFLFKNIDDLSFVLFIPYLIGIFFFYYKNIQNNEIKRIIKIAIAVILFFSLVKLFELTSGLNQYYFSSAPLLFIVWNITSIYFIFKYYTFLTAHTDVPTENFVKHYSLTPRENEILLLLSKGHSYKKISGELFVSLATVKTHIHNLYSKTDVKSRHELLQLVRKYL